MILLDHLGVHPDVLKVELEILRSNSTKDIRHCSDVFFVLHNVGVRGYPPSTKSRVFQDAEWLLKAGQARKHLRDERDRAQRGTYHRVRDQMFEEMFNKEYLKTDLSQYYRPVLQSLNGPRFGEVHPFRDGAVGLSFEKKHWASLALKKKTVLYFPPGRNGRLASSLVLGEVPSEKGYPIFNVVTDKLEARYAIVKQHNGMWHWQDWIGGR